MPNSDSSPGLGSRTFEVCKICGGTITELERRTPDGLVVAECNFCGLLFVRILPQSSGKVTETTDSVRRYYAETVVTPPPKFHQGLKRILEHLAHKGSKPELETIRLLDVGCGDGEFLLLAEKRGFRVAGLEHSPGAATIARERGLADIHVGDLADVEGRFDVITLFDVAEHLEDPVSFFEKAQGTLNTGGFVYVETPRKSLFDTYMTMLSLVTPLRNNRISQHHLQLFSDPSLQILFAKCGFDLVSFSRYQSLSWANRSKYIQNLGVKSKLMIALLTRLADVAITLHLMGRNKAVVIAEKTS